MTSRRGRPISAQQEIAWWIDRYETTLSPANRTPFINAVRPLLVEHLPLATKLQRHALFAHWEQGGGVFPSIFKTYDAAEWLAASRVLEIVRDAREDSETVWADRFAQQTEALQAACTDSVQYDQLIAGLFERYQQGATIEELCQILDFLPHSLQEAVKLLHNKEAQLPTFYERWLTETVASIQHLSVQEQAYVQAALLDSIHSKAFVQSLMRQLHPSTPFKEVEAMFSCVVERQPSEAIVLQSQPQRSTDAHTITVWREQLERNLCISTLQQIFPEKRLRWQPLLDDLFQKETALFREIAAVAHTSYKAAFQSDDPDQHLRKSREALVQTLHLLQDYTASPDDCKAVLALLHQHPYAEWVRKAHAYLVDATFQPAQERSLQEILDGISAHLPQFPIWCLRSDYDDVDRAYRAASKAYTESKETISNWQVDDIQKWARCVKPRADVNNHREKDQLERIKEKNTSTPGCKASKAETLAVIQRAVEP